MMRSPHSGKTGTTVGFSDSPRNAERPSRHSDRKHRERAVQEVSRSPSKNGTYRRCFSCPGFDFIIPILLQRTLPCGWCGVRLIGICVVRISRWVLRSEDAGFHRRWVPLVDIPGSARLR